MKKFTIDRAVLVKLAKTMTFKAIGEMYGIGPATITRIAQLHKIKSEAIKGRAQEGEIERVFELAAKGMTHRAIAMEMNRSDSFVFYHLHKWRGQPADEAEKPRVYLRLERPDRAEERRLNGHTFEDAPQRLLDKERTGPPIIGARASAHCREIAISSSAALCADAG